MAALDFICAASDLALQLVHTCWLTGSVVPVCPQPWVEPPEQVLVS